MDSIIEALEQIEAMLLLQQAQINHVTSDVKVLAKLLQALTEVVKQGKQQEGESDRP